MRYGFCSGYSSPRDHCPLANCDTRLNSVDILHINSTRMGYRHQISLILTGRWEDSLSLGRKDLWRSKRSLSALILNQGKKIRHLVLIPCNLSTAQSMMSY